MIMGQSKYAVHLTDDQRSFLERLVRRVNPLPPQSSMPISCSMLINLTTRLLRSSCVTPNLSSTFGKRLLPRVSMRHCIARSAMHHRDLENWMVMGKLA